MNPVWANWAFVFHVKRPECSPSHVNLAASPVSRETTAIGGVSLRGGAQAGLSQSRISARSAPIGLKQRRMFRARCR